MTGRAGSVVGAPARALGGVAFALALALAACGQKGPLIAVKPAPGAAVPAGSAVAAPASAASR